MYIYYIYIYYIESYFVFIFGSLNCACFMLRSFAETFTKIPIRSGQHSDDRGDLWSGAAGVDGQLL